MFNEEELPKIITDAVGAKLPGWQQEYFKRIAKNLQVHTKGLLFDKVTAVYPYENPASQQHCIATYEPVTRSSIWKGINNIIRIFQNTSFSITASDKTLEYISELNFDGKTFSDFFLHEWVNNSIATDPNSLIVVYPQEYTEKYDKKSIVFIESELILKLDADTIVFQSKEESEITWELESEFITSARTLFVDQSINALNGLTPYGASMPTYNRRVVLKVVKPVYHIFTKGVFIRVENYEKGKADIEQFDLPEAMDYLPVRRCGGMKVAHGVDDSFVSPFIPFGNLALLQHRNHRAVDLMFSYPRMGEIETPCDNCTFGEINVLVSDSCPSGKQTCGKCNGSGFLTPQSPYKVYSRKFDPSGIGNNEHLKYPPVEYYTPDVGILDYSKDGWKESLQMGEEAIYVQQSEKSGNIKSSKSKEIDKESMYAWLFNISKSFYGGMEFVLQAYEDYLNKKPEECSVEYPDSFAILTEEESFKSLNEILTSSAPVFVKDNQLDGFINKFVSKTNPIVKVVKILKQVDPLLYYTTDQVGVFKSNNIIDGMMWATHVMAYPTLMQMYTDDKTIFDQEDLQVIKVFNDKIKLLLPKVSTTLKDNIIAATPQLPIIPE